MDLQWAKVVYVIIYFSSICMYISNSNTVLALNTAYAYGKQHATVCTDCQIFRPFKQCTVLHIPTFVVIYIME